MLVISNRPRASRSADLKLLARLLPELYSTRSNYYYKYAAVTQNINTVLYDCTSSNLQVTIVNYLHECELR